MNIWLKSKPMHCSLKGAAISWIYASLHSVITRSGESTNMGSRELAKAEAIKWNDCSAFRCWVMSFVVPTIWSASPAFPRFSTRPRSLTHWKSLSSFKRKENSIRSRLPCSAMLQWNCRPSKSSSCTRSRSSIKVPDQVDTLSECSENERNSIMSFSASQFQKDSCDAHSASSKSFWALWLFWSVAYKLCVFSLSKASACSLAFRSRFKRLSSNAARSLPEGVLCVVPSDITCLR